MRRHAILAVFLALTLLLAACDGLTSSTGSTATVTSGREQARVVKVIDGDTIDVEIDGQTVRLRYIGIDTPETVDPRRPVGCFGAEASKRNSALVKGKTVELEKDVSETDSFGRLLRYVYLDGEMINQKLVSEGYAFASAFPPDVKHQSEFDAAQREARAASRGLWAACPAASLSATATPPVVVLTPAPGSACPEGCVDPPPGCQVKGNISASGVKIYHLPNTSNYNETVISPDKGERWFCTTSEAEANGWRPPN